MFYLNGLKDTWKNHSKSPFRFYWETQGSPALWGSYWPLLVSNFEKTQPLGQLLSIISKSTIAEASGHELLNSTSKCCKHRGPACFSSTAKLWVPAPAQTCTFDCLGWKHGAPSHSRSISQQVLKDSGTLQTLCVYHVLLCFCPLTQDRFPGTTARQT